jgi:hypothetical protein
MIPHWFFCNFLEVFVIIETRGSFYSLSKHQYSLCRLYSGGNKINGFNFKIPVFIFVLSVIPVLAGAEQFDFKQQLFGTPSTLSVSIQSIDTTAGYVVVNGADSRQPTTPFTWNWGDGTITQGWFPSSHTYSDRTKNYIITVTSHYTGGGTGSAQTMAHFVSPQISPRMLPSDISVTIPDSSVTLTSRMPGYNPPPGLTYFDDSFFPVVPRSTVEYILTAAASMEKDFVNYNTALVNGGFQQVLLRDPSAGGMYSLWFTSPVAFAAADYSFLGSIQYSSFMHEMGHNFTLNTPGDYYYGGKIDGWANAIYSESMAQIFQHAAAYQIINNAEYFGLGDDLVFDINNSAVSSMNIVRNSYDAYVAGTSQFHSWNDPATPDDETFGTFMTVAYKFFEHAENSGQDYRIPARKMLKLLQLFDADLAAKYDRLHNNSQADAFRATLMVAAVSYAFSTDLRSEFSALNFPLDSETYDDLMFAVSPLADFDDDGSVNYDDLDILCGSWLDSGPGLLPDLNDDKTVNFLDFAELASLWWLPPADFNKDGSVNYEDLALFCNYWLDSGPGLWPDLNGDTIVDFLDFAELASVWH